MKFCKKQQNEKWNQTKLHGIQYENLLLNVAGRRIDWKRFDCQEK